MKAKLLTLLITFFGFSYVFAQSGWKFPSDEKDSLLTAEKNALYTDNMKLGNFKQSVPFLVWILNNVPDLNESIYINGAKIYESLASMEKNPQKKRQYEDSTLLMYDLRIKYYDDEAAVLNRKAFSAYDFYKDDKSKYQELFELFKKTFELNGNKVWDQNLLAFMDVVRRYKLTGGNVSDDEVLDIYDQISDIIDYKMGLDKNTERLEKISENVDKLLAATVKVDCDFIQNKLAPKLKSNPEDLKLAKNIFKLALIGKCLDNPVFMDAAKSIYSKEPNYGMAKMIGDRSYSNKEYDLALKFYGEAIDLTEENLKKAELYSNMASIQSNLGNKPKAREYALKAISADPGKKEAYNLIGNLYYSSYEDCKRGENEVNDRAVFFAAYEMYRRAGNSDGMQKAKEQFPTMETIFTYDMAVGQQITVGCWINETVSIQRRD